MEDLKRRCDFFEEQTERYFDKLLQSGRSKKESKATKVVRRAGLSTTILFSIGCGLAIAMGVSTFGIGSFVGAAVAAATLVVVEMDEYKGKKAVDNLQELKEDHVASLILSIVKETAKELSRIYENQLFRLKSDADVKKMASCAANLMFKLKAKEEFNRNNLLKKVVEGTINQKNVFVTTRHNKKWELPDVFQKTGLRKEILFPPAQTTIEFKYFKKADNTCDPETYGYRGQILKMIECIKTKNESAELTEKNGDSKERDCFGDGYTCSCSSGDGTDGPTGYFYYVVSDIDKKYTVHCEEMSRYQPFHCLVRCPCILESFASLREHSSQPSLKQHVSKMFKQSENRPVKPVYRSHSPRAIPALNNCNLSGSDFTRGHFANSSLNECDLTGCTILFGELSKVNCCGSCFKETYFSHCNLAGMVARDCEWTKATVLYSCASEADLRDGKNLIGAADWTGTPLGNALTKDSPCKYITL